eukprot:306618-Prymnesium_polylepis.1
MDIDMDNGHGHGHGCQRAMLASRDHTTRELTHLAASCRLRLLTSRAGCAGFYQRLSSAPIDIAAISTL